MPSRHEASDDDRRINRRRVLSTIGATGAVSVAGCLGGDDPEEEGEGEEDPDVDDNTLRGALGANVDSFDPPHSSDTTSTMAQGFLFEGLTVNDSEGNIYPWLAEDFELLDVQDIDRLAYEPYMSTVGTTDEDTIDTGEQIIVRHPEDNPAEDDEVRVLLSDDAVEAAEDGTYGMHFRYDLHEGVEFHNGDELTAEDVVATYEYAENSQLAPQTYDSVLAVTEVDEYTVDMYAQVPDAEGERELPGLLILNSTQIGEIEKGDLDPREGNVPIGTGPYEFDEFEDEQFYEVEKFDDYWVEQKGVEDAFSWFDGSADFPDGPVIERIELEVVPDDATRSGALQNDEVDITYGLSTGTLDDFDADDGFLVHGVETGGYEYIQYPVNDEPFDDRRVRQAINHLVPRQQIVDNVLNGWARPAWTDLPELAHGSGTVDHDALEDEIRPTNEFDTEAAADLLDDVASDHGDDLFPLEVQLEVNADNDDRVQLVELIAESMEQSGYFETEIETYEWNTYVGRVLDPEYPSNQEETIIPCIGLSGTFNPHSFCDALHNSSNIGACCNLTGISDPDLDELLDTARFGADVAEDAQLRAERYDEIWRTLAEEAYSSITHFDLATAVTNTDVEGFTMWPFNEGIFSYNLFSPQDEQYIELNR